jgi:hypothetical protein
MGCRQVVKVYKEQNQIELLRHKEGDERPSKDFAYDAVYDIDS